MPRYDYECGTCGRVFELTHAMSDETTRHCPDCGAPVRRKIAAPGIIVKSGASAPHRCGGGKDGCAYESTGQTCCGRGEPCGE